MSQTKTDGQARLAYGDGNASKRMLKTAQIACRPKEYTETPSAVDRGAIAAILIVMRHSRPWTAKALIWVLAVATPLAGVVGRACRCPCASDKATAHGDQPALLACCSSRCPCDQRQQGPLVVRTWRIEEAPNLRAFTHPAVDGASGRSPHRLPRGTPLSYCDWTDSCAPSLHSSLAADPLILSAHRNAIRRRTVHGFPCALPDGPPRAIRFAAEVRSIFGPRRAREERARGMDRQTILSSPGGKDDTAIR